MEFFKVNATLYRLLSKVVSHTQLLTLDESYLKESSSYPRMIESSFTITEDIIKTNQSTVTAHYISEYRPSQLKIERLMRESHVLLIDLLVECTGGVRGVSIQGS